MERRRGRGRLGDVPQAPEDAQWREIIDILWEQAKLAPKKPLNLLLRELAEIAILAPQHVVPVRNLPFKADVRKFVIPGVPVTGTGTGPAPTAPTETGTAVPTGTGAQPTQPTETGGGIPTGPVV